MVGCRKTRATLKANALHSVSRFHNHSVGPICPGKRVGMALETSLPLLPLCTLGRRTICRMRCSLRRICRSTLSLVPSIPFRRRPIRLRTTRLMGGIIPGIPRLRRLLFLDARILMRGLLPLTSCSRSLVVKPARYPPYRPPPSLPSYSPPLPLPLLLLLQLSLPLLTFLEFFVPILFSLRPVARVWPHISHDFYEGSHHGTFFVSWKTSRIRTPDIRKTFFSRFHLFSLVILGLIV